MKKSTLLFVIFTGLAVAFTACSGGGGDKAKSSEKQEVAQTPEPEQQTTADDALTAQMKRGEELYKTKCIICHQPDAKGVKGAFPPLAQSDYLLADPVRAVAQTLNGSHEEMIVNGETYNAPMTPQVDTKEDAIAVINYVLNNFGNDGGYVTLEDVKDVVIKARETQPAQ